MKTTKSAVSAITYALLTCLVSIGAMAAISLVGTGLSSDFNAISSNLSPQDSTQSTSTGNASSTPQNLPSTQWGTSPGGGIAPPNGPLIPYSEADTINGKCVMIQGYFYGQTMQVYEEIYSPEPSNECDSAQSPDGNQPSLGYGAVDGFQYYADGESYNQSVDPNKSFTTFASFQQGCMLKSGATAAVDVSSTDWVCLFPESLGSP